MVAILIIFLKKFFYIFIFLFSFSVFADDISDFQIEGMSIGDSALDYFTEKEINENLTNYYNYLANRDYYSVEFYKHNFFNTYDSVEIFFRKNDDQYIIQALGGAVFYKNNIKDCDVNRDSIIAEVKNIFKNAEIDNPPPITHAADSTGKSTYSGTWFMLEKGLTQIACYNWSSDVPYTDHLYVGILLDEINEWLTQVE